MLKVDKLEQRKQLPAHNIVGIRVAALNYAQACDAIITAAIEKRCLTVSALAVHGIMTGALDREHRIRLNSLDLLLPDGQPIRWALNALYHSGLRDRVYGPNLMLYVCDRAAELGLSVGLYGNEAHVLDKLKAELLKRFPKLMLAATIPSCFSRISRHDQSDIAAKISGQGVDILFVGLGCPRQEVWLYENRVHLNMPMIAVGAAFDFHALRVDQAPYWMQRMGLEWLFRLSREPKRLWRRYILLNPIFVVYLLLQCVGVKWGSRNKSGELPEPVRFEGFG